MGSPEPEPLYRQLIQLPAYKKVAETLFTQIQDKDREIAELREEVAQCRETIRQLIARLPIDKVSEPDPDVDDPARGYDEHDPED